MIFKIGWEKSPEFLFGLNPCELRLTKEGIIKVRNGPNLNNIINLIINEPDWFMNKIKAREIEINSIKLKLAIYISKLKTDEYKVLIQIFEDTIQLYVALTKYIYITQFSNLDNCTCLGPTCPIASSKLSSTQPLRLCSNTTSNTTYLQRSISCGL